MATAVLPPLDVARSTDDEPLYEVIDGQRVELPEMSVLSNLVKSELHFHLRAAADPATMGRTVTETLFILDADGTQQRRPDVAFVSKERWPLDREIPVQGEWQVVPDLCVEVTSPHDAVEDLLTKIDVYFAAGVRQVWVTAAAQRRVYVFDSPTRIEGLSGGDILDGGEILPGFRLPLTELFTPLRRSDESR